MAFRRKSKGGKEERTITPPPTTVEKRDLTPEQVDHLREQVKAQAEESIRLKTEIDGLRKDLMVHLAKAADANVELVAERAKVKALEAKTGGVDCKHQRIQWDYLVDGKPLKGMHCKACGAKWEHLADSAYFSLVEVR